MLANTQTISNPTHQNKNYVPNYIFCLMLNDGTIVVGQANNASKRIANINSGANPAIPVPLSVYSIMGVKEANEERTFAGVVAKMAQRYGEDKVLAI